MFCYIIPKQITCTCIHKHYNYFQEISRSWKTQNNFILTLKAWDINIAEYYLN